MAKNWREIYDALPEEQRQKVDRRTEELLAEIGAIPCHPAAPADKSFIINELNAPVATGEENKGFTMNLDRAWLEEKARLEDGCFVVVGADDSDWLRQALGEIGDNDNADADANLPPDPRRGE